MVALLSAAPMVGAQDAGPLAVALTERRPARELVPQSCPGDTIDDGERICVREPGGLVRALRRVSLGGSVQSARRDGSLFFSVRDEEFAARFVGHVWRWDLATDSIHSLGELGHVDGEPSTFLVHTSLGILYRTTAGLILHEGGRGRAIATPDAIEEAQLFVEAGVTYGTWLEGSGPESRVSLRALELDGSRIRTRTLAALPGHRAVARGPVIAARHEIDGTTVLAFVVLPGSIVVEARVPFVNAYVTLVADGTALRVRSARRAADVDVRTGAVTPVDPAMLAVPPPPIPTTLAARSIHDLTPSQSGVWLRGSASRGVVLDAAGVTVRLRAPRERTSCRCRGEDLVCGRTGPRVPGACAASGARSEVVEPDAEPTREVPRFTGDGRFRIDRLEPDYARITRLTDGARLWVRLFGDTTILAQLDDGTYFLSDRELESRLALRDGRSILDAPIVPLASRASELYRATLVADFFAPP